MAATSTGRASCQKIPTTSSCALCVLPWLLPKGYTYQATTQAEKLLSKLNIISLSRNAAKHKT